MLSITEKAAYQKVYGPMFPHIKFTDFNDLESVKRLITKDTCAICLETVQGEEGIYPVTKDFLTEIRQLRDSSYSIF